MSAKYLICALFICFICCNQIAEPEVEGKFLSGKHATPAYQLYGLNGLDIAKQPSINQPENLGYIGYHVRSGKHDLTVYDWEQYLDFADRHLEEIKD